MSAEIPAIPGRRAALLLDVLGLLDTLSGLVLVYATSATGPLPYRELLERSGAHVVLYGPDPGTLPAGWVYGGEGRVTGERLAQSVPDAVSRRAFVSGPPALVNDLRKALRSQGARRVHSDYFSGY